MVSNCVIYGSTSGQDGHGTGVGMTGGLLVNSVIRNNTGGPGTCNGVGVNMSGGLVRGCLIYSNDETSAGSGGGVYGGCAESSTICFNRNVNGGGTASTVVSNSIVYFNTITTGTGTNYSGGSFGYSCTTPNPGGVGNITGDPLFVNAAAWDFRLSDVSPCINVGTNLGWMAGAADLGGISRILENRVDMGAYEFRRYPRGTMYWLR